MSASKTVTNHTEFIKLSNKIDKLTKIVDHLQKEVKAIKQNTSRNENKQKENNKWKNLKKSEIIENKSKTKPFERLRFFRKNDKTSEKSDSYEDSNKMKDENTNKSKASNDQHSGPTKNNDAAKSLIITPKVI